VAGGITGVVVVMIVLLIVLSLGGSSTNKGKKDAGSYPIPASAVDEVVNVPVSALVANAKGEPGSTTPPEKLPATNALLTDGGKPEIVYMGGEFCPYCAAERWALVMALAKFGTFADLTGTTSSATDVYANTPTFSFYGSTYTSKYLSFVPVELYTNSGETSAGWPVLQKPTALETALITKWDAAPYTQEPQGIPFVYIAGRYVLTGPQFVASQIAGRPFLTAASEISNGKSDVSKQAEASAGYLVGDFCALTKDQPASVCSKVPASLIGITTSTKISGSATKGTGSTTTTAKKASS
jgi:thiol-disulfide isomerase/thioredoxin